MASGNTVTGTSQPLRTIASTGDARFTAIARLVDEWQPDALVVGVPFHPDGAAHENTALASCAPGIGSRCMRSTSDTPPPRHTAWARVIWTRLRPP